MREVLVIALVCLAVSVVQAPAATTSTYSTTYGEMSFTQDGSSVWGTYTSDSGEIIGALNRNELRGWWREAGNAKACGPSNAWSGEILFVFAPDGKSFNHGDWNNCDSGYTLSPTQINWTGTFLSGTPINTGFVSFPADCVARASVDAKQNIHVNVPCLELGTDKFWIDLIYLGRNLELSIINYGQY